MNSTLYHGVSGIKTHQFGIDSVSNNISNINTDGYRGNIATFKSLFARNMDYLNAGRPVNSDFELGSTVQSNAIDTREGSYKVSDESPFNMALGGNGWFIVGTNQKGVYDISQQSAPSTQQNYFTRAGAFKRNNEGYVVNDEGYYLYGVDLGKISNTAFTSTQKKVTKEEEIANIKSTKLTPLRIPEGVVFQPTLTENVNINININKTEHLAAPNSFLKDSAGTFDTARFLDYDMNILYVSGGGTSSANDASSLNSYSSLYTSDTHVEIASDSQIDINIYDSAGTATTRSISYGTDFNTIGEFLDAISEATGMEAEFTENCNIRLTNSTGENITVEFKSKGGVAQALGLATIKTTINGTGPANTLESNQLKSAYYTTNTDIYDKSGEKYILQSKYSVKNYGDPNAEPPVAEVWEVETLILDKTGQTKISQQVYDGTISFDKEGKPTYLSSTGGNKESIDFLGGVISYTPAGDSATGGIGLSTNQIQDYSKTRDVDQDGNTRGMLTDVGIDNNGWITLYFSNNKSEVMGRVGVANFVNDQGLQKVGSNMFEINYQTINGAANAVSGFPIVMWDNDDGNLEGGYIMQGKLEGSNVEMSTALTELIIYQRGYSANAKSFTTGDELLKEAIGLKR